MHVMHMHTGKTHNRKSQKSGRKKDQSAFRLLTIFCFLTWTQVTRVLLSFALLFFTDVAFFYELNEGKTLLQQKVMTRFITVVWNRTHNLSEVCLYFIIDRFYTLFWMYIAKINTLPPPHLNLAGRQGVHRLPQVHKHQIYGVKLCEIKEKENLYIVKW